LVRISQSRFDKLIISLLKDCISLSECNCDNCPNLCILCQELKMQNIIIDDIPDILNSLRLMFLEELTLRNNAIMKGPRYEELTPLEYYKILSDENHYIYDLNNEISCIY
jgi:hypothetical protein